MIEVFLKNTQTLIGSLTSNIVSNIYRIKPKYQAGIIFLFFALYPIPYTLYSAQAYDPSSVPNNKFGIHIISPVDEEASGSASLVNSSGGDWGYITVLIEEKDRSKDKWQSFFDKLRKLHLIPIVRIATAPQGDVWKLPYDKEEEAWADFLNNLNWPVKNRYVVVYNEPNQGQEWAGSVDPNSYAQVLDKTINALRSRSSDFFVLNAGFDASAPNKLPSYEDEQRFLSEMNDAVPGIFEKLDGWASHSYPNPGFAGSPTDSGRGTIRNYQWELSVLRNLGVSKDLPVFITETGWKHAEGIDYDKSLPTSDTVGDYFKEAFQLAWSDPKVVAVTPFLLNYQQPPFDHFSFKKLQDQSQNLKVLGATSDSDQYYPEYLALENLTKVKGAPVQDNIGQLLDSGIYRTVVAGQSYNIHLTFKNTGESIWGETGPVKLIALAGGKELGIEDVSMPQNLKVEPGQKYTFNLMIKAPQSGIIHVSLALYNGPTKVITQPLEFTTEVKSPVILVIKSYLKWKEDSSGNYFLGVAASEIGENLRNVILGNKGVSDQIEARDLLPDYGFDFTLERPFYQKKTIHRVVHSGVNTLDFGELTPDIGSAILNPRQLWKLLPWSR